MGQRTNIKVAGQTFTMTAGDELEEEIFRRAAAAIDKTIEMRQAEYRSTPHDEVMTMIAFNECKARIKIQMEINRIKSELEALQAQLGDYLEKTDK